MTVTPPGIKPRVITVPDSHGKSGTLTRKQLYVIHTIECPLAVGRAKSTTDWGNGGYQPRASWHRAIDPATVVRWIPTTRAAWHAAPVNRISIGYEQSGYARYSREQWLTEAGRRQIDVLAQEIVRDDIPANGVRWLTDAQVRAIIAGSDTTTTGLVTHAQVVKVGTALGHKLAYRSDPGAGYPRDVLLDFIRYYHPGIDTRPKPAPSTGDDLMAAADDILAAINDLPAKVWAAQIGSGESRRSMATAVARAEAHAATASARAAGLEAAVASLSAGQGVDPKAITDAVDAALRASLARAAGVQP